MADTTKRSLFCTSLLGFTSTYNFDGADIDWEYPGHIGDGDNSLRPNGVDAANFVTFLQECSPSFKSANKLLTIANGCNPSVYEDEMDMAGMDPYLDMVNLMAYDMYGAFDSLTNHQSQMYRNPLDAGNTDPYLSRFSVSHCINGHIAAGTTPSKINIGIPFYARSYKSVDLATGTDPAVPGLFASFSGTPKGTWDAQGEITGIFDYSDILLNKLPSAQTVSRDPTTQAPSAVVSGKGSSKEFYAYDDRTSVCMKSEYVNLNGLGGTMFWEMNGDAHGHQDSLINAMYCGLNPDWHASNQNGCANVC